MPRYYGQISLAYATENLQDTAELHTLINELVSTWEIDKKRNLIDLDDLNYSTHKENEANA
jgi:hypothetical protein